MFNKIKAYTIIVCLFITYAQNSSSRDLALNEYTHYNIGVDVGGTNTDAAIIGYGRDHKARVIATFKSTTTNEPAEGIENAMLGAFQKVPGLDKSKIHNVMLGTTHLLNAVVQAKGLNKTAVIRLGLPATTAIPPLTNWNRKLIEAIGGKGNIYIAHGGYEYDGTTISEIREEEIVKIAHDLKRKGINSAAITGVFAHVRPDQERQVMEILTREYPGLRCSLSLTISVVSV